MKKKNSDLFISVPAQASLHGHTNLGVSTVFLSCSTCTSSTVHRLMYHFL